MEKILEEINSKLEILVNKKDDFELLTAEQIAEETGIPINNIRKLFNDKDLAVQTYTKPRLVTRKAWNEFISERRGKQMKRSWKNFKLDPNKVYMRIGQATVCILFNLLLSVFMVWGFLQGMTY